MKSVFKSLPLPLPLPFELPLGLLNLLAPPPQARSGSQPYLSAVSSHSFAISFEASTAAGRHK